MNQDDSCINMGDEPNEWEIDQMNSNMHEGGECAKNVHEFKKLMYQYRRWIQKIHEPIFYNNLQQSSPFSKDPQVDN